MLKDFTFWLKTKKASKTDQPSKKIAPIDACFPLKLANQRFFFSKPEPNPAREKKKKVIPSSIFRIEWTPESKFNVTDAITFNHIYFFIYFLQLIYSFTTLLPTWNLNEDLRPKRIFPGLYENFWLIVREFLFVFRFKKKTAVTV